MPTSAGIDPRHRSRIVTEGVERAPHRAMLRATGLDDDALARPLVGVASTWNEVTPCNLNLNTQAQEVKAGIRGAGGTPQEFGTIAVSDAIAMGHEGMKASLVSREVIADSIELMAHAQCFDAVVALAGCDKSLPGSVMALARLNLPGIFLYGGTIMPGQFEGHDVTVQDVYEAVGRHAQGRMSTEAVDALERRACPGAGSCGGLFTANTMAAAIEAIGLSLPGAAAIPAVDPRRDEVNRRTGEAVLRLLRDGIRPRDILTRPAFENAIRVVVAMGGSTNAVLHLLAIAREAGVDLAIDDFDRLSRQTPRIADMKPGGRYVMADLDRVGGVPVVMRALLEAGLLDGDAPTVTGQTVRQNLTRTPADGHPVVLPAHTPLSAEGGLAIVRGTPAPDGAVIKTAGIAQTHHRGLARVFDREEDAFAAIMKGQIQAGDVVVIRYEGPRGGPGMREMLGRSRSSMKGIRLCSTWRSADSTSTSQRRSSPRVNGSGRRPRLGMLPARSPSTPGWCRRHRRAQSPDGFTALRNLTRRGRVTGSGPAFILQGGLTCTPDVSSRSSWSSH